MKRNKHLYHFVYKNTEKDLCGLESRNIFNEGINNKLLFSEIKVDPSNSAFIKHRIDIINYSDDYSDLIDNIKKINICIDDFKVEYIVSDDDITEYDDRLIKLKDIGYSINGFPDYHNPKTTFALCNHSGVWYFGEMIKNKYDWQKHKHKPRSYSNSINMNIAKALVNIAAKGNKNNTLIDACCGVGTVMLEACFASYNIDGCDINEKIYNDAKENISFYNYNANIFHSDIKDINKNYDAAIIDLPYNIFSNANNDDLLHIVKSTANITNRIVIVSITDISELINTAGLLLIDYCSINKTGKRNFVRRIWVCEKA